MPNKYERKAHQYEPRLHSWKVLARDTKVRWQRGRAQEEVEQRFKAAEADSSAVASWHSTNFAAGEMGLQSSTNDMKIWNMDTRASVFNSKPEPKICSGKHSSSNTSLAMPLSKA